ncbi:hypothetical protein CC78DRAFT_582525 [Lojkania enalia]|uniref:Uncharacterized protein n=1 Tax=Lojkania enalia TaxID=147567 RepID=A0A9P4K785_9PLEO|nr:hypothetical protein CC78DRAFT_582525 [Didymosphaeria enalia]
MRHARIPRGRGGRDPTSIGRVCQEAWAGTAAAGAVLRQASRAGILEEEEQRRDDAVVAADGNMRESGDGRRVVQSTQEAQRRARTFSVATAATAIVAIAVTIAVAVAVAVAAAASECGPAMGERGGDYVPGALAAVQLRSRRPERAVAPTPALAVPLNTTNHPFRWDARAPASADLETLQTFHLPSYPARPVRLARSVLDFLSAFIRLPTSTPTATVVPEDVAATLGEPGETLVECDQRQPDTARILPPGRVFFRLGGNATFGRIREHRRPVWLKQPPREVFRRPACHLVGSLHLSPPSPIATHCVPR